MKNVRSLRLMAVLLIVPFLGACAGGAIRPGPVTPTMADADFVKASSEVKTQYLQAVQEEDVLLTAKKSTEYMAGRPVAYGDSSTGYTLQWDKKLGIVYIYPGHNPGAMSIESEAVMAFRADKNGNIHYQNTGGVEKPTTLLANVATQEGVGRMMVKGVFQVLGSTMNGAVAAKIHADSACGDGCGNTTLINAGGNSQSLAGANATSGSSTTFDAVFNACPTCVAIPMK